LPSPKSLYDARLLRDGWKQDARRKFMARPGFYRSVGKGWDLYHDPSSWTTQRYRLQLGDREWDTHNWDWADLDGARLVWTSDGCLRAGNVESDGIFDERLLHDFNGMKFQNLVAPYEGGVAVTTPTASAPSAKRPGSYADSGARAEESGPIQSARRFRRIIKTGTKSRRSQETWGTSPPSPERRSNSLNLRVKNLGTEETFPGFLIRPRTVLAAPQL
jgi:hypothetical protein